MNELDQLDGLAAQADAAAAAQDPVDPNAPPAPEPVNFQGEAAGLVDMFAALVVGYAPKTESIWHDAAKARVVMALVPVMEKYNFSMGGMPVELVLLITAGPLLWQTSRVVAKQMEQENAAKAQTVEVKASKPQQQPTESPQMQTSPQSALYK
jgi:hypothetical protein